MTSKHDRGILQTNIEIALVMYRHDLTWADAHEKVLSPRRIGSLVTEEIEEQAHNIAMTVGRANDTRA
jgi:hypothetical protein